ncbi:MAG: hypothetical protein SH807_07785 [Blastochloris sp.]|jgi:hypothetical protein|nr:hypothetical protein [Blastochloris sp.]
MKNYLALVSALLFLVAAESQAQVNLKMSMERETYLLYESFPVRVDIENVGDQQISLKNNADNSSDWISFLIYRADGTKVRSEKAISISPVTIEPGAKTSVLVDLTPVYALRDTGQYKIKAVLSVPGLKPFVTDALVISIGKGESIWSETRMESGIKRVATLIKFLSRNETTLYARIEEPSTNTIYTTQKLGRFTDFTKPVAKMDATGSLHVVHTLSGQTYRYSVVSAEGTLTKQEDRLIEGARPQLIATSEGGLNFFGGTVAEGKKERAKLSQGQQGGM